MEPCKVPVHLKILNNEQGMVLSRFRTSNHHLAVETGRWTNIPPEERICVSCRHLEDEYHMIFECALYEDLRQPISDYLVPNPRSRDLSVAGLLGSTDKTLLHRLAKFLVLAQDRLKGYKEEGFPQQHIGLAAR